MEDKITFEDNMARLGKIVAELEKGDIALEKAVELYSEGVKLTEVCRKQLDESKIKITEDNGTAPLN
ncbi:MAG: exodeoxyribonuclease VII small subunit [Ruminococcus sp.]|nr:exodeoxyribonuclease VII small subunit [Ruminococcus sp.]